MVWDSKKAKEIVTFKTGKLDSNAAEEGGKYPFFTCAQETYYINKYAFDTECVLLAGNNAAGIFPLKYYKGKFNAYQRTYVVEPQDRNKLDTRFLYNAFIPFLKQFEQSSTGVTTKFLTMGILNNIWVPFPQIIIQRKIAAILSAYDDLIENNNRRIAILEKMAEELYREWFVRLRFPGHEKVKIVKGVPEGWEVLKLGDVCKVARGSSPRPITDIKYFQDGNIPWIKIADATSSKMFIFNTKECVNEFGASFSRKLPRESLIIATSGTLGFCILLGVEGCVHDGWMYLTQYQKNIKPSFIYYVINSYKEHLNNLSYGAAIQNINTEIIRRLSIMVPSLYIIDKFYLIVNPIQKNIYNLGKENILLQNIRDRLLSRLMSGKIDVENMDIQFPASMRCAEPVEAQEEAVDA